DDDLLSLDDVDVTLARGGGLDLRRVGAGRRLGDAERLEPQLAARDLREVRTLLDVRSVLEDRAHRVHLRVARAGVAAAAVDFLENDRRVGDSESRAAVLLRNQRGEIAGLGERLHERVGIRALRVELAPVRVREGLAEIADRAAEIRVKKILIAR